jgi:beta-galactosidase
MVKAAVFLFLIFVNFLLGLDAQAESKRLSVDANSFILDGRPLQILSGELHYPRIPHEYWENRMLFAKAMGLNTITAYVFWNVHEPQPGQYDFRGDLNVAEFIKTAQRLGLHVILRPGPYVCAEWDLGGLPAWLLKDRKLQLRSKDPVFLRAVKSWFHRLGKELAPLTLDKGGPIIAVQVENEYGSFGNDHEYVQAIRSLLIESGFGSVLMYTADGADDLENGSLPGLPAVVNFGAGHAKTAMAALAKIRPKQALMAGEYWTGWFDDWGDPHHTTDLEKHKADIQWMMEQKISMSFYMFHGGTNFGFMAGANYDDGKYMPYVTSYDYDAPLSENGQPTKKYFLFKEWLHAKDIPMPKAIGVGKISGFALKGESSLWSSLPAAVPSRVPLSMEDLDQNYGYVLYQTKIPVDAKGPLKLEGLNDYAEVYLDKQKIGTLDRREPSRGLDISAKAGQELSLLVLNSGRTNYSMALEAERKGIKGDVYLRGLPLSSWNNFSIPETVVKTLHWGQEKCQGPCFRRFEFAMEKPMDSFLDMSAFHKGVAWVNGRALGRYWDLGPQTSLYVPAPWIKSGVNELVIFDSEMKVSANPTSK